MVRFLVSVGIQLLANAIGLLVATLILPDMKITAAAFVIAVLLFTAVYTVSQPFFTQLALEKAPALRGGVALVATLVGLLVTAAISDGFDIHGILTWLLATGIVWLVALVGAFVLPMVLIKEGVEARRENKD